MRRRALLAALTATAGCSGLTGSDETPTTSRSTPDATVTGSDLPYRGDGSTRELEPQGFTLQNESDRERYVTVVVEHEGETVFVESETIPSRNTESNGRREFEGLVAAAGIYRVIVETADGARTVHDWVVFDDGNERRGVGSLFVVVEDEFVWTRQQMYCDPLCGPISLQGEAVGSLPYVPDNVDESSRTGTSNAILENTGETATEVRVRAEFDGETIVDYTYDVRPGLMVAVPLTNAPGVIDLTLEADGATKQYEWHAPEESYVFSDVADGVGVNCRLPRQYRDDNTQQGVVLEEAVNHSTEPQTLSVTARAEGEQVFAEQYEVDPGARTGVFEEWQAHDRLDLTLELNGGERVDAHWTVCPSKTRRYDVGIDPDGTLALLEWDRPIVASGEWNEAPTSSSAPETPTATTTSDPTPTPEATPTPESTPTDDS